MAVRLEILVDDKGTVTIKRFTDGAKKSLDEVEKKAKTSAVSMSSDYRAAGKDIVATFRKMQMGFFAFAGAAAGITAAIKATIDYGDRINDLSKATGVAVETLSALDFAAKQSGTNIDAVAVAFKTLAMRAGDAESGLLEAKRSFADLKVDIFDATGKLKTIETVFFEVADAIKNMEDKTKALSLASEVLGRGALEMGSMLSEGSVGIKAAMTEAKNLGQVWKKENTEAADAAADAIGRFNTALVGLRNEAVIPILPHLAAFFDRLAITADLGLSLTKLWVALQTKNPKTIFIALAEVSKEFTEAQREMAELIKRESAPAIGWLSTEAYEAGKALDAAKNAVKGVVKSLEEMPRAKEGDTLGIRGSLDALQEIPSSLKEIQTISADAGIQFSAWDDYLFSISNRLNDGSIMIGLLQGGISTVSGQLAQVWSGAQSIADAFRNIGRIIYEEVVAALVEAVLQATLLKSITGGGGGGILSPLSFPFFAGSGALALQHGAVVRRPAVAVIGESGPEAVVPLSRGKSRERQAVMQAAGLTGNVSVNVNVNARNFDRNFVKMELVPLLNREVKKGMALYSSHVK